MRIKIRQTQNCYIAENLNKTANILQKLKSKNAKHSELYFKNEKYYILSEKQITAVSEKSVKLIKGYLEEYAKLISKNALTDVLKLL